MFTIFFNSQRPVVIDIMPDKTTITAAYYTTSVLPKVLQRCVSNQQHGLAHVLEFNCIMTMHLLTKYIRLTQTHCILIRMVYIRLKEHPPYSPGAGLKISIGHGHCPTHSSNCPT
jgi:hypothetical protein